MHHVSDSTSEYVFIAAADSTGHGVPGAMVSVVCSNALNRAVKEFNLVDTGSILDKTRELVLETFSKSSNDVKDGMDISLLCVDKSNDLVFWSGANNPLWYIENNEMKEIKANKQPIGKIDNPMPFTTHRIKVTSGMVFYLFTDGFADQFGGPNGKKFKYKGDYGLSTWTDKVKAIRPHHSIEFEVPIKFSSPKEDGLLNPLTSKIIGMKYKFFVVSERSEQNYEFEDCIFLLD